MTFGARELLFLVVMVALLFSAWHFVFKNADERINALDLDTLEKRTRLIEVTAASARIQDMDQRIAELQEQLRAVEAKLPRARETRDIVAKIDREARSRKGLNVLLQRALNPERAANYFEQPLRLQLRGDFKEFYDFLLRIETMARITRINQMRLTKINEADGSMEADMTLSIYFAPDITAR